mgnify:CR=1 FL=1
MRALLLALALVFTPASASAVWTNDTLASIRKQELRQAQRKWVDKAVITTIDCLGRAIMTQKLFGSREPLNRLILQAAPGCVSEFRVMFDRFYYIYGGRAGVKLFDGADILPALIEKWMSDNQPKP